MLAALPPVLRAGAGGDAAGGVGGDLLCSGIMRSQARDRTQVSSEPARSDGHSGLRLQRAFGPSGEIASTETLPFRHDLSRIPVHPPAASGSRRNWRSTSRETELSGRRRASRTE